MKIAYKWVNLTLVLFFIIIPLITFVPLVYLSEKNISYSNIFNNIISPFYSKLYILNYFFGLLYTIGGIGLLITCFFKKKKPLKFAIKLWITGLGMLIIPTLVFYTCMLLNMCALSLPDFS